MCFSQCCNKVTGKPSPATAGSRATLHRFFETPEKPTTKQARELSANIDTDIQEEGTGDAIPIALPSEKRYEDGPGVHEDTEVGAKAAILRKQGEISLFDKKEDRQRRKQERVLRRDRKVRRQLRLASATPGYGEVEGPASGGVTMVTRNGNQIEASDMEGVSTNIINIGNKTGGLVSATELQGETKMGQPSTDVAAQRAEEGEVEETMMYVRRIQRKKERAVHVILQ